MANLVQLRDRVDTWLADKWPTVVARQENYRTNRGVYWQGLKTHTITPVHTNGSDGDSIPDQLNASPTDQFSNWSTVFPEWDGVPIPCSLAVDVYSSPEGEGWVATLEVVFNGVTYSRSQNVGPLSNLTKAWHEVEVGPE